MKQGKPQAQAQGDSAQTESECMSRPVHCGRNATPYWRGYGRNGWESGYRCKVCGKDRLPTPGEVFPSREAEYDRLRAIGAEWDTSPDGQALMLALAQRAEQLRKP